MLDIEFEPRRPRVLFIGSGRTTPSRHWLTALREAGYDVFHVGEVSRDLDISNISVSRASFSTPFGNTTATVRMIDIENLIDMIGITFDLVFHVQDHVFPTNRRRCSIPYFYLVTEVMAPYVPSCAHVVLCATDAIKRMMVAGDNKVRQGYVYMPHAVRLHEKEPTYPSNERPILASFAGELYKFAGKMDMYVNRRETVLYLEGMLGDDFSCHYMARPDKHGKRDLGAGRGRLGPRAYNELLRKSKIGINAGTVGGMNFRDLEVPLNGAMLVTMETPDHALMGFEDGVNCRFYETPEEALEIVKNGYDPDIARAGWELVTGGRDFTKDGKPWSINGHLFRHRVDEVFVTLRNFAGIFRPKPERELVK